MEKSLTKTEFNILSTLATKKEYICNSNEEKEVYSKLLNENLIQNNKITQVGLNILENYRAKRAIFIAAGFGSRLVPITINTPKPLIKVNGTRMIDTLIDACLKVDIKEIYIVRGYLGEQFDQLKNKYPMIKFIDNPYYKEANNISSAYLAKDLIKDSYVFEADLVLSNPDIITKYHYHSDVLGIWKEKSDDWCLTVDNEGNVVEEKTSGEKCYQMVGIYYFNKADGNQLEEHLNTVYNTQEGKQRYWETVPNQVYKGNYKIEVRECKSEDIVEIDTFRELQIIDKAYEIGGND